ncbi:hypothetical protein VTK73DRAFT_4740 [Phialemonium thermophilum]|uniref:Uncharacterized protein n=1 Tax=Phialemonium thermophilum TaxID=223376 RepID=A0ABR3V6A4_9PEZI
MKRWRWRERARESEREGERERDRETERDGDNIVLMDCLRDSPCRVSVTYPTYTQRQQHTLRYTLRYTPLCERGRGRPQHLIAADISQSRGRERRRYVSTLPGVAEVVPNLARQVDSAPLPLDQGVATSGQSGVPPTNDTLLTKHPCCWGVGRAGTTESQCLYPPGGTVQRAMPVLSGKLGMLGPLLFRL